MTPCRLVDTRGNGLAERLETQGTELAALRRELAVLQAQLGRLTAALSRLAPEGGPAPGGR